VAESRSFLRRTYEMNEAIVRTGGQGDYAYVVEFGLVEISREMPNGQRRLLGMIQPGGIFGEMALVDGRPRVADAIAREPTRCLLIPPEVLREKLERSDPFVRALLRILVKNVRSLVEQEDAWLGWPHDD